MFLCFVDGGSIACLIIRMSREMCGAVAFEDEKLIDKGEANLIWPDPFLTSLNSLTLNFDNHHCDGAPLGFKSRSHLVIGI